ncbi:QueT transporter family protein [Streptococcus australis]|uniref:QueT transporter family protein n=1 Tax=Streptococcus australis TaxID=113107 RepID=UPI0039C1F3EC
MKNYTVRDLAQIALVAALYVALTITPPLNAIGSNEIQFRVSEMLNFMAFYNRKYIWSVTIGCMISNFMSYGIVDLIVGGGSTLVFVTLGVYLFKRFEKEELFNGWIRKDHFLFSILFALSMFTIALELHIINETPFFLNWLTTGLGEFASLIVGAILIKRISNHIDLTQ